MSVNSYFDPELRSVNPGRPRRQSSLIYRLPQFSPELSGSHLLTDFLKRQKFLNIFEYFTFILKQYAYLTYHHFSPENPIGNEFITCSMGNP